MLGDIFDIFASLLGYIVLLIILCHVAIWVFFKKSPVKLDNNSFVVITGACMGIGRQMALEIARQYKSIILVVDRRKDLFDQISQEITEAGGTCECKYADLANDQSVKELINFLLQRNSPINLFLYNAGIVIPKRTWNTTEEEHNLVMKVNYFTPTLMIKKLEPLLINNHVAVVVSIVAIVNGGVDISTYSASKHALFGYLSSLRQQYKKDGKKITISMGCPYAINTTLFEGFTTKLDWVIRPLKEDYVGKRLVKEFVQKKQVCFIYQYEAIFFKLFDLFPTEFFDPLSIYLNDSKLKNSYKVDLKDKKV